MKIKLISSTSCVTTGRPSTSASPFDPDEKISHGDSRGHTGLAIGDVGSFYSKSTKQQLVATSSTHAEVKALYPLSVDILYLINLSDEIQRSISLPAVVVEDNNPTVQLSSSLSSRIKKSKHFVMLID